MENAERELLELVAQHDQRVKRLYDEHLFLDREVESFKSRKFITSDEEVKLKQLKSKKLRGKRMLMQLIEQYRARGRQAHLVQ